MTPHRAAPTLVAFHLPHFHPTDETDRWWGPGHTDWNEVVASRPRWPGHHQPHLPGELGFYDLRVAEVRERQAQLAGEHGIGAFCHLHHWFEGRRLFHRPVDEILASGRPDFPFMLCWANERWTRPWGATNGEVLIEQTYSADDDRDHIRWLIEVFRDPRYLRIDDRPVFIVRHGDDLPDPLRTTALWRAEAVAAGLPGLHLLEMERSPGDDPARRGFDGSVGPFLGTEAFTGPARASAPDGPRADRVIGYGTVRADALDRQRTATHLRHPVVVTAWDDSPRRPQGWATVLDGASPQAYEQWLVETIELLSPDREQLVFLSAWNDWADGSHLEPDQLYGRSRLEATKRALSRTASTVGGPAIDAQHTEGQRADGQRADGQRAGFQYSYDYRPDTSSGHVVDLVDRLVAPGALVVDLGAGAGVVGPTLRAGGFGYHGVELHDEGLQLMRAKGLACSAADVTDLASLSAVLDRLPTPGAILLLDVMEHLMEPQALLTFLSTRRWEGDPPVLILSVPNVAHRDVAIPLLLGRWDYAPIGLLDATHIRFFTEAALDTITQRTGWRTIERHDYLTLGSAHDGRKPWDSLPTSTRLVLEDVVSSCNRHADVFQFVRCYATDGPPRDATSFAEAIGAFDDRSGTPLVSADAVASITTGMRVLELDVLESRAELAVARVELERSRAAEQAALLAVEQAAQAARSMAASSPEAMAAELDRVRRSYESSTIWRATRPVRWVLDRLRGTAQTDR